MTTSRFPSDANRFLRLGGTASQTSSTLGVLADLVGTWAGTGVNLISVPRGANSFEILLRPYAEILTFAPVGAPVPNRGGVVEQFVGALTYDLRIWDLETNAPMHVENGMWLNLANIVPAGVEPHQQFPIARQASIPHGDVFLAPGTFSVEPNGVPSFPGDSGIPDPVNGPDGIVGYSSGYGSPTTFPLVGQTSPAQPGQILRGQMTSQGQEVNGFTTLSVATTNGGGILNIPFIERRAAATSFSALFWIENASRAGQPFLQLQYQQTTNIEFLAIKADPSKKVIWPHINVATLVKQ